MSTSTISAALAGLVIGVGATFAFRPNPVRTPTSTRNGNGNDISSSPSPIPFPGAGAPPSLLHGKLTTSELVARYTVPGTIGPISDLLLRTAYTTAYDRRLRIPAWTAEHLTAASLRPQPAIGPDGNPLPVVKGDRQNSVFREDESVPEEFRAHLLDYFKSGYDRGHMVPAADAKISQKAMDETFLLTNIAPQVGEGFNRHYWAYLESFCRSLTSSFSSVYIFTVPLFLPKQFPDGKWRVSYEMIAPPNTAPTIAVPTHFAKVILASRPSSSSFALVRGKGEENVEWSIGAFVLPNEPIPDEARLESFVVPVEAVESSAGLSLFPKELKSIARPLCQTVECKVVVRRFDDAQKKLGGGGGGRNGGRRERSATL